MCPEHLQEVQPLPRGPAPGPDAQRRGARRKHLHILQRHVSTVKTHTMLMVMMEDIHLSRWMSTAICEGFLPNIFVCLCFVPVLFCCLTFYVKQTPLCLAELSRSRWPSCWVAMACSWSSMRTSRTTRI